MVVSNDVVGQDDSSVKAWRWIATVLAVSQLAASPIITWVFGDFLSSGATNEALITPSGYAFSIWGLITLLTVVTCVAIIRVGLGAPWERRVLVETSVVFLGFSCWLIVAAQNWLWFSVAVFAVMVGALVDVVRLLVRHAGDLTCPPWLRRLATLTFGLYLGWSSVAVFANVAAASIESGASADGTGWQAVILAAATAAALALTVYLRGSLGYVAAVLWALIAATIGAAQSRVDGARRRGCRCGRPGSDRGGDGRRRKPPPWARAVSSYVSGAASSGRSGVPDPCRATTRRCSTTCHSTPATMPTTATTAPIVASEFRPTANPARLNAMASSPSAMSPKPGHRAATFNASPATGPLVSFESPALWLSMQNIRRRRPSCGNRGTVFSATDSGIRHSAASAPRRLRRDDERHESTHQRVKARRCP